MLSTQNEIRLTDLSGTRDLLVADMTSGESGQVYLGLSIAGGDVAFFRGCQGDPAVRARPATGVDRYDIATRRYQIAGANEAWTGWAWDGSAEYHVPSAFDCSGGDSGRPTVRGVRDLPVCTTCRGRRSAPPACAEPSVAGRPMRAPRVRVQAPRWKHLRRRGAVPG